MIHLISMTLLKHTDVLSLLCCIAIMAFIELFIIIQWHSVNSYEPLIEHMLISLSLSFSGNFIQFLEICFLFILSVLPQHFHTRTHFKTTIYRIDTCVYHVLTSSTTSRLNVECFSFYVIIFTYPEHFPNHNSIMTMANIEVENRCNCTKLVEVFRSLSRLFRYELGKRFLMEY